MRRLLTLLYASIAVAGFFSTTAYSQSSAALQQQSVASQMDGIAARSAETQADSIRRQAASIRQQYGASLDGTADSLASGKSSPIGKVDQVSAAAANLASVNSVNGAGNPPPNTTTTRESGFFSVPWQPSTDFAMPNVEVAATSCDALGNDDVSRLVKDVSGKYKLDPALLRAVMRQESGLRPCAMSTAGAMGLMQIMPETAGDLGLADPFDPAANVDAGAHYLKQMLDRYNGNASLALAAYNAGPGRTDRANGIPPLTETIGYVSSVLSSIPLF
jgi:soluble lytic murein transglycosylase-like protein